MTGIPAKTSHCVGGLIQSLNSDRKNTVTHLLRHDSLKVSSWACVWMLLFVWHVCGGSCMNDHSELSHQVQFSGKHLISCERQPSKQASRSFRLVSGEAGIANGSCAKCLCGAENDFLRMHFLLHFFWLSMCSYRVAPSSCLFRPLVVQKWLKFTEADGISSSIQCKYMLLSRQPGCGCRLCSALVPSQQWISFVGAPLTFTLEA